MADPGDPIERPDNYRTLVFAFAVWAAHFAGSYAGVLMFPGQSIARWIAFAALAAALLVGALWLDISGWLATGLAPTHNGMGATVFMLAALQGQVVVVAVIMATYLAFREARGLLSTPTNVTMDIVARFIGFAAAQGVIFTLVPRVFPGG